MLNVSETTHSVIGPKEKSAVLEYCIALEMRWYTQPGHESLLWLVS